MLTKADFQTVIADTIASYPTIAPLYQAGDPRIIQHLDAMAAMLALMSAQIEVAMTEPFEKVRDSTVMADAAMRGIVVRGTPATVQLLVENTGSTSYTLSAGRNLLDTAGYLYRVNQDVTVQAGGNALCLATQIKQVVIEHTVSGSRPFYAVEIPSADDESYLCQIAVAIGEEAFSYSDRYVNVAAGEKVYHVEADDRQRVYVRFGYADVVGVQPNNGDVVQLTIGLTHGDVNPEYQSQFAFEYVDTLDMAIKLAMNALVARGQDPLTMSALRDLARYPSVYDGNAVYLGEFDFLVRRNFPSLRFLSVWNEVSEERARGPSWDNINVIFVACLSADGTEPVLTQPYDNVAVPPEEIVWDALTVTQQAIKDTIIAADNSYRVRFMTPVKSEIHVSVSATVSASYNANDVKEQIIGAIIDEYGIESISAKRGRCRPNRQRIYSLFKSKVTALSDGLSDIRIDVTEPAEIIRRPEMWRYVSTSSLTVDVAIENINTSVWSW